MPGQPADARVPQIARALDINAQQRRQLGQLRGLFLQKLGRIVGERQDINGQLAVRPRCVAALLPLPLPLLPCVVFQAAGRSRPAVPCRSPCLRPLLPC